VIESDESNNTASFDITVNPAPEPEPDPIPQPKPDLSVEVGVGDYSVLYTDQFIFSGGTVTNNGDVDAGPFSLLVTCGDFTLTMNWTGLAAHTTQGYDFDLRVTTTGEQTLSAVIDSANTVAEEDETNNSFSVPLTFVAPTPKADLVSEMESVLPQYTDAENGQVQAFVSNVGPGEAQPSVFMLRDNQGNTLSEVEIPQLASGQTVTFTFTWPPMAAGSYALSGEADATGVVDEENEANNGSSTTLVIVPTPTPSGSITVTKPMGGSYSSIRSLYVSWTISPEIGDTLDIHLSLDDGQTWQLVADDVLSRPRRLTNSGYAYVSLPNLTTNQARIRVSANGVAGVSDRFEITTRSIRTRTSRIPPD
jgi:subtilase family serine protease